MADKGVVLSVIIDIRWLSDLPGYAQPVSLNIYKKAVGHAVPRL